MTGAHDYDYHRSQKNCNTRSKKEKTYLFYKNWRYDHKVSNKSFQSKTCPFVRKYYIKKIQKSFHNKTRQILLNSKFLQKKTDSSYRPSIYVSELHMCEIFTTNRTYEANETPI